MFFLSRQRDNNPSTFAHDILPVLQARCAKCHANGVLKGGLSIETREQLMDSGVVELGEHAKSNLFEKITSTDPDQQMPPEGERLSAAEVQKFAAWIDAGLSWPAELSLKKKIFARSLELGTSELPPSQSGSEHPVDRIVDDYFQRHSVERPERLSDSQFLRRAKLDLLGQLPTIAEIENFATDPDPLKHEKLVDGFLSRDRDYADHWISFWNDLLRNDYVGTGYIDGGREQINEVAASVPGGQTNPTIGSSAELSQSVVPNHAGFIKGIKWRGRVNASQIRAASVFAKHLAGVPRHQHEMCVLPRQLYR